MRLTLLLTVFAAALVAGAAAPAAGASDSGPIGRATSLLRGKRFTRFLDTGSIGVPSSYDERLHLCSNGRFILDQVSNVPDVGDPRVTRTTGSWRVVSASFGRNGAFARIRGVPQQGRPVTIVIARSPRGTTIDGSAVIVGRSDLCR
jgi:hypothetical protein